MKNKYEERAEEILISNSISSSDITEKMIRSMCQLAEEVENKYTKFIQDTHNFYQLDKKLYTEEIVEELLRDAFEAGYESGYDEAQGDGPLYETFEDYLKSKENE